MTEKDIIKGNELIKKFMPEFTETMVETQMDERGSNELMFHRSYDWIIPVVEKIEEHKHVTVSIFRSSCIISGRVQAKHCSSSFVCHGEGETKLEAVFMAVIDFLEEYLDKPKEFAIFA